MEEITPVGVGLHSYRLKWWAQVWYLAWGVLAGGLGVFIVAAIFAGIAEGDSWDFLDWRGLLRERSADVHEITGYRVEVTRNATFWKFELKNGECLFIMRFFDVDSAFHDFLSHLRDLNGAVVPTTLFSN